MPQLSEYSSFQKNNLIPETNTTKYLLILLHREKIMSLIKNLSDGVIWRPEHAQQTWGSRDWFLSVKQVDVVGLCWIGSSRRTTSEMMQKAAQDFWWRSQHSKLYTRFYLLPLERKEESISRKKTLLLIKRDLSTYVFYILVHLIR